MPKYLFCYLFCATYTADGVKGLEKDDVVVLADLRDNASATAFTLTVSKSGVVRTTTTPLISVQEADRALERKIGYRVSGPIRSVVLS